MSFHKVELGNTEIRHFMKVSHITFTLKRYKLIHNQYHHQFTTSILIKVNLHKPNRVTIFELAGLFHSPSLKLLCILLVACLCKCTTSKIFLCLGTNTAH